MEETAVEAALLLLEDATSEMAKLIDGSAIAKEMLSEVAKEIKQLKEKRPHFKPSLAVVQVSCVEDSGLPFANGKDRRTL